MANPKRVGGSHNTGPVRRFSKYEAQGPTRAKSIPERNLIAAMLHRAFIDIGEGCVGSRDARLWVIMRCPKPGGYLWACDAVGLIPLSVREIRALRCTAVRTRKADD